MKRFGVIEGFYGDPWSQAEREACIDVLAAHGANSYVWAPKSEPRHRDAWGEPFTPTELAGFQRLVERDRRVTVSIGLTPGADATLDAVVGKLAPVVERGCGSLTLCFDDLPVLDAAHRHRELANGTRARLGVDVLLVPTHYAGTTTSPYLAALCDGLDGHIELMWTGETVVTEQITTSQAESRAFATGGRRPLLWDNVPVNDALMTAHLHVGPYVGRPPALRQSVAGVLLNPMPSMRASLPTIESACAWWRGQDPIAAWRAAVDRDGLRLLAEATAYPGEPHWPGDRPPRGWVESVASMPDVDPDVDPWVAAARAGARLALSAMDVIDGVAAGRSGAELTRPVLRLTGLTAWLQDGHRTLGAGPRIRPVATQDADGAFVFRAGCVVFTTSIVESLVRDALAALAAVIQP